MGCNAQIGIERSKMTIEHTKVSWFDLKEAFDDLIDVNYTIGNQNGVIDEHNKLDLIGAMYNMHKAMKKGQMPYKKWLIDMIVFEIQCIELGQDDWAPELIETVSNWVKWVEMMDRI